jgi:hypothetical protein
MIHLKIVSLHQLIKLFEFYTLVSVRNWQRLQTILLLLPKKWLSLAWQVIFVIFTLALHPGKFVLLRSGQWSVVSRQWSVVSRQWSVVSRQWSVVSILGNGDDSSEGCVAP